MNKNIAAKGFKPLSQLWQQLTEPMITVKDKDARIRSRFLAQLFLAASILMSLILTLRFLMWPDVPNIPIRLVAIWLSSVLLLGSYRTVRSGYMKAAVVVFVFQSTALVLVFALLSVSLSAFQSTLTFLIIIPLFTSQFYSIRFTLVVAVFHLFVLVVLPFILPVLTFAQMIKGPLAFYILLTALAVVFAYYRSRIEETGRSQLAESESRFKMVSDLIPNYAFSVSVEKTGLVRNEWVTEEFSRLTGYTTADITPEFSTKLFHPDDLPRFVESIQKAYTGQSTVDDYRFYTKTGEIRWLRLIRNVVWDADENRLARYYGVAQDITAQKTAEAHKIDLVVQQERSKLVRDFVTAFSHDFRTSLATIETSRYLAEHLIQRSQNDQALTKLIAIRRSVTHMSVQLENLNAIATLTNLQRQSYDLNALLEQVITEYGTKARQHNQMINFQPNAYIPRVNVDADELNRAFRELLRNALSFMPDGGVVTIKTLFANQQVETVFNDTGIGIPPQHLDHIFDFFYRVDSARGTNSGGVGLGLSVAKMIVEAHGGSIRVESKLDVGSTFTVRLPFE